MRPFGRGLLGSGDPGGKSQLEGIRAGPVDESERLAGGSGARVGRYSLSDNGEGARHRAARQTGSEGQVKLCQGESQLEGQQEQERWSTSVRAGGVHAHAIVKSSESLTTVHTPGH